MDTEMVTPFQLHRVLDHGQALDTDQRISVLGQILNTGILAVIRRIPQTMSPFSDQEKEVIARWADRATGDEDVSDRDFAFHLMANCNVPATRILGILEQNKTFSRSALEHIQTALGSGEALLRLDEYLSEVAEKLLAEERIPSRDRGRHMLMTLARSSERWAQLAFQFSDREISDLRQRVIERFLAECPEGDALTIFADNVVKMCLGKIGSESGAIPERIDVTHMHWVFMCLERIGDSGRILASARAFRKRFVGLPLSILDKVETALAFTLPEKEVAPVVLPKSIAKQAAPAETLVPARVWRPRDVRSVLSIGITHIYSPARNQVTPPAEVKPPLVRNSRPDLGKVPVIGKDGKFITPRKK
ncbi:MAG: hypothetical protein AAB925_01045 [Patescibacteria group bacterium]